MRFILSLIFLSLFLPLVGCTAEAICLKEEECASDPPGPDFVEICTITRRGQIDALKANDEDICQELANASLAFDACRAELACDDYNDGDLGGRCDDEADDLQDAFADADNECGTSD